MELWIIISDFIIREEKLSMIGMHLDIEIKRIWILYEFYVKPVVSDVQNFYFLFVEWPKVIKRKFMRFVLALENIKINWISLMRFNMFYYQYVGGRYKKSFYIPRWLEDTNDKMMSLTTFLATCHIWYDER